MKESEREHNHVCPHRPWDGLCSQWAPLLLLNHMCY